MEQAAEITVKGYGNASAMPDGISISLSVLSHKKVYAQTIEGLNTKVSAISLALTRAGCTESAVTKSYGVSEVWTDQYDFAKRQFQGYQATQKLGVTIPVDNVLLGRVFEAERVPLHVEPLHGHAGAVLQAQQVVLARRAIWDRRRKLPRMLLATRNRCLWFGWPSPIPNTETCGGVQAERSARPVHLHLRFSDSFCSKKES